MIPCAMTATELSQCIRDKKISCLEVTEAYLARIEEMNGALNAVVTLNADGALARAREADEALLNGETWGPLHGVPITIKDSFETAGLRTTGGHPPLADYVPKENAPVVARLLEAGAILLGKTNLPELAMDHQTDNALFGRTNNPWDLTRTPGGSSGGSGSAVAASLSTLGLGSDIGGSIRIPAHFCGLYGLKTSEGLLSNLGHIPDLPNELRTTRHMGCFGPLARSVSDLSLCLSVLTGPEPRDLNVPPITMEAVAPPALSDLRIAWTDDFPGVPVSESTRNQMSAFLETLAKAGATVEKQSPPGFDVRQAWETYGKLLGLQSGALSSTLMRFIIRQISRKDFKDIPAMKHFMDPISLPAYMEALAARDHLAVVLEAFLSDWDVWILPTTATPAFKHIEPTMVQGPFRVYRKPFHIDEETVNYMVASEAFTCPFNVTGNPVVNLPIGQSPENLPIGVQVVGRRWKDSTLLAVCETLASQTAGFLPPPNFD